MKRIIAVWIAFSLFFIVFSCFSFALADSEELPSEQYRDLAEHWAPTKPLPPA